MRVVGVDPGGHIGMCLWIDDQYEEGHEAQSIKEMARQLDLWRPALLVVEDFRGGYAHTNQRDPLMAIGALTLWSELHGIRMVLQSPGILRVRLRQVDDVHPSRHVRCAAAHVLHHLRKGKQGVR